MVKINYKSDFKINERSETVALEVPFVFSYYVFDNKKYVASFDGNTYVNCERKEDGSLDVIFNSPGFGVGRLKVERKYAVDDKAFVDGVYDIVTVDKTDVFITSGKTFETYIETLVVPPYIKGDKGDPMTWSGMTEGEQSEIVQEVMAATQEAQLVEQVTGNEKISVSDGSGLPKAITTEQIKNYIEESKESSSLEFVDLGLPSGNLWATRNIGARSSEDSGLFFAWGETEGYNVSYTEEGGQIVSTTIKDADGNLTERKFTFADYKWSNGAWNSLTKYNTKATCGVVDNLNQLLTDDDAAHAVDKTCRIPSVADYEELIQHTTFSIVSINSKNCGMFTAANGKFVVFPIGGTVFEQISNVNSMVYYPTCEVNQAHPSNCRALYITNSGSHIMDHNTRCVGSPVRAVKSKETGGGTYDDTEIKAQIKENADNIAANKADADAKLSELGSEVYSNACGKNLFNKSKITEGFFIGQNGKETPNAEYFYAEIPVKPNTTYYINKSGVGGFYSILDAGKKVISTREQVIGTITIPSNGFYIRISTRLSNLDTLQVEVGDKGTNYENYFQSNRWYDWYKYASVIVGGDINNDSLLAINKESYLDGFLEGNGKVVSNTGFSVTDYIEIPTNTLFIDVVGIFTNPYGGGVGFYDESKTFISSIFMVGVTQETNERYVINTIDIPQNARYIRSCAIKKGDYSTVVAAVDSYNVVYKILKGSEELKKALNKNSDDINSLMNFGGKNLFDKSNITEGYFFDFSGTIISNADYFYSDYIPVKENETYYINKSGVGGGYVIYNESKMRVSSGELKVGTITIPGNGFYIRISTALSNLDTLQVEIGTEGTSYEEYYGGDIRDIIKQNAQDVASVGAYTFPRLYKKESFVEYMNEGDFVEIPNTPNLKNKHSISFHANVGSMGKLRMSHGTGGYIAGIFEVDGTNIYVYSNSSPSTIISTIPHGLNISEYIHIQLRISDTFHSGNVTLTTANGQSFRTEIEWNGCSLNATVNCLSGSYSKAKLIFGGNAWKEKVWIFGDSYTDYWPRYMEELRASKFLLDGYSGRGSAAAYTSFVNELEYGMPGVVLWMMGMNDADTSDAISSYYKTNFDKIKMLCESKGIIFVPCTIPNVPERIHTFKNQYIKDNSQYYIDMAKVLGAEEMYSSWNTGLLSGDKVHPTNAGAKLIALTLCEEIPSMLND